MATLTEVRNALKATLEGSVGGLRVAATIPDTVNPPMAIVNPVEAQFDKAAGRGLDEWSFELLVCVGRADQRSAQLALDEYVSGGGLLSIRQAVFQNPSLGIENTHAVVTGVDRYGNSVTIGSVDYASVVVLLTVRTKGA